VIDRDDLAKGLQQYLPRQRWFSGTEADVKALELARVDVLSEGLPGLVRVLVDVEVAGATQRYQVFCGVRPVGEHERFLEGKDQLVLGELSTDDGSALVYDGLVDPDLALVLLHHVAPDQEAERVRPLTVEQSNTSIVFDEKLILKVFRRVAKGPNPDAEVTRALASVGFEAVAPPIAEWRGDDEDYAVVNQYLSGGSEGWYLALTSLRDVYDLRVPPEEAGGDFGPEAGRLGSITASMHLALGEAFGTQDPQTASWAADMERQLERVRLDGLDRERILRVYRRLAELEDPGVAMRIHGDLHLGQTMRTDSGWYVLDFEGEPNRPLEERRRPSSPLRDVAGMLRSFHYASQVGLVDQEDTAVSELGPLARQWEARASGAFRAAYFGTEGIEAVLPAAPEARALVLGAFELDKAVYEVGYEIAHRPTWVHIPLVAVDRILEGIP
jgi:maltokinase